MSDAHEELLGYRSVRTWLDSVQRTSLRPELDQAKRLDLLAGYVARVGADPDAIVERSRADVADKNRFLKELVSWAATLPLSEKARHDAENVIRGFFMRNGFRVVARPYRDVYQRPRDPS